RAQCGINGLWHNLERCWFVFTQREERLYLLLRTLISSLFLIIALARSHECVDGTYRHDGRYCCRCGVGLRVDEHCTENLGNGKCESCPDETYSSEPNGQTFCEPCTSCSQPNDNLEVAENCSPASNRRCQCQKDHYCASGTENCRLCHPCNKCGAEGIKVECTGNNNTVCNDKIEGKAYLSATICHVLCCINWNLSCLSLYFLERDIGPLLPDIAKVIGWRNMRDVAMRSSILDTVIESCRLNHPGDTQEQTLELLKTWVEKEGSDAGKKLVECLRKSHKNTKAKKILYHLEHCHNPVFLGTNF
uniref:Uncharacterized protein n=1 Tax=Mola mola TaxID=94237 RepID=A0A3Q3WL91_MOLML